MRATLRRAGCRFEETDWKESRRGREAQDEQVSGRGPRTAARPPRAAHERAAAVSAATVGRERGRLGGLGGGHARRAEPPRARIRGARARRAGAGPGVGLGRARARGGSRGCPCRRGAVSGGPLWRRRQARRPAGGRGAGGAAAAWAGAAGGRGPTAWPAPFASARPLERAASLRRLERLLPARARTDHGLLVRVLRVARRLARGRSGTQARADLPQAEARAR